MDKLKIAVILLAGSFMLSSCVTLLGRKKEIYVDSYPKGASVYADGSYVGTTPCTFKSKKPKSSLSFKKDGYESKTIYTSLKHRGHIWWNMLFTGFLGVLVDIPYIDKYAETSYYASLQLQPKPTPKPTPELSLVVPEAPSEMRADYAILSKIVPSNSSMEMDATTIFEKYNSAVFMIYTSDNYNVSQGSGFFVSSDGIGISNYHVFKGAYIEKTIIKLSDGSKYQIQEVLAYSKKYDYIVFKVQGSGFNHIPVTKSGYKVGNKVYAISSPEELENTISSGIVSGKRSGYLIQHDAYIDHGSSGGALINRYGEIIGITSGGKKSGANLNFSIDIRVIYK